MNESKLYSFLDDDNNLVIHFFEGQKLIYDIALTHKVQSKGFFFFRDSILSLIPLSAFLKHDEGLGIFVDSENPYFRFKIETHNSGSVRALFLPETFDEHSERITGQCRISKTFPKISPYTSIIDIKDDKFEDIIQNILEKSYQLNAKVILSEKSDQSALVLKLPNVGGKKRNQNQGINLNEYILKKKSSFFSIFNESLSNENNIINEFQKHSFTFLENKEIRFYCPCSKERFIINISNLNTTINELFAGENEIETKCDYCKKIYIIKKSDLHYQ